MEKRSTRPPHLSRQRVTVELLSDSSTPPTRWEVLVSIPGREGTSSHQWDAPTGTLTAPVLVDLCAFVERCLTTAIALSVGVQEGLPIG